MEPAFHELGNVMLDPMGLLLCISHDSSPLFNHLNIMPTKLLRRMLLTSIWHNHQRGLFGLHEAARQLSQLPFLSTTHWSAHDIARVLQNRTVTALPCMLQLLDILREELHLRLFCVCNASVEELHGLRCQFPALFAKFDATFTSGEEGVGKPSLRFLQIAMEKAGIFAHRTLYIDSHDVESIIAARTLGMHALLVKPAPMNDQQSTSDPAQLYDALIRDILLVFNPALENLLSSPTLIHLPPLVQYPLPSSTMYCLSPTSSNLIVPRKIGAYNPPHSRAGLQAPTPGRWSATLASARKFLLNKGAHDPNKIIQHASLTSDGIRISDNFAQFLMADLLDDTCFLPMQSPPVNGIICFINKDKVCFGESKSDTAHFRYTSDACTFNDIPEDLDTTSIGLSVLHKFGKVGLETIHTVLDKMLKYVSKDDGILQVYFDTERPRIDPVVVTNAVFLFHLAKRGHEVEKSERFVESVLLHRAYKEGTLYYNLGEAFLLSVARLVHRFEEHFTRSGMRSLLAARLQEQKLGLQQDRENALALVMRMRACALCGLVEKDAHTKEEEQSEVARLQKGNGSWNAHGYYRYGSNAQSWIGNEALTTAYAVLALQPI